MEEKNERYEAEVLKRLEAFKNAVEWSDFIGLLGNLDMVFEKYACSYIPHQALLVKRLNQCLNPVLPAGVHLKTLETYGLIFEKLPRDMLVRDFAVLTLGLFPFAMRCRILVTGEYLDLLERYVVPLAKDVDTEPVLLGLLPTLESESSEFYDRSFLIVLTLQGQVQDMVFYDAVWRIFVAHDCLRVSIVNFLSKARNIVAPDYRFAVKALCCGLESDSLYVVRSMLDFVSCDFPLHICRGGEAETAEKESESLSDNIENKAGGRVLNTAESKAVDDDARAEDKEVNDGAGKAEGEAVNDGAISDKGESNNTRGTDGAGTQHDENETRSPLASPKKTQDTEASSREGKTRKNRTNNKIQVEEKAVYDPAELKKYNSFLIRNVLKIFLKKEAGINKRTFKWLNISKSIKKSEIAHIEAGLRTYLNSDEDDLVMLCKILYSLSDKENLAPVLIERIILDLLSDIRRVCKNPKKFSKHFNTLGLDYIYRVFYLRLRETFENTGAGDGSTAEEGDEHFVSILELIIFAINELEAVDSNVRAIHLPLLANLIVRNKSEVRSEHFDAFMTLFFAHVEYTPDKKKTTSSLSATIDAAYQKESFRDLADIDLIHAIAFEMSDIDLYAGGPDLMVFGEGEMHVVDGIIVHVVEDGQREAPARDGADGVFTLSDMVLFQTFIERFGVGILPGAFLKHIAGFLVRNYKFKFLIDVLSEYIIQEELYKSMWSDFIRTKVPSYLFFFNFSRFILQDLPRMDKDDVLSFLTAGLAQCKYYDVLFAASSLIDRQSPEFVRLLLSITHPLPLLRHLLECFNGAGTYASSYRYIEHPNFNKIKGILSLLSGLLNNSAVLDVLNTNAHLSVERFDCKGARNCTMRMLAHLIVNEYEEAVYDDSANSVYSVLSAGTRQAPSIRSNFNASVHASPGLSAAGSRHGASEGAGDSRAHSAYEGRNPAHEGRNPTHEDQNPAYSTNEPSVASFNESINSAFYKKESANTTQAQIQKYAFHILHKIHKKGISVHLSNMPAVKDVIVKYKDDHRVVTKSLFLVLKDTNFIIDNYLANFREIFYEISKTSIRNTFMTTLVLRRDVLTAEMLVMMHRYLKEIPKYEWESFYSSAMAVFGSSPAQEECRAASEESSEACSAEVSTASSPEEVLPPVPRLANMLWEQNKSLFIKTFFASDSIEDVFSLMPFKIELFAKMVPLGHSLVLRKLLRQIDAQARSEIFVQENEFFKNAVYSRVDYHCTMLILELLNNNYYNRTCDTKGLLSGVPMDRAILVRPEKYRSIIGNVLYALESRITSGIKLDLDFQHDVDILANMLPVVGDDPALVGTYKTCLFTLLHAKCFSRDAFVIIDAAIRKSPGARLLIDGFLAYVNGDFFGFAVLEKCSLVGIVCGSRECDSALILDRLFHGLDTSYFFSQQNVSMQKIHALRRMAFFVVSNPRDFFGTFSDRFVAAVNTLLGCGDDVRAEAYRLCTAMLLRINHAHIAHLYPLIIEDLMRMFGDDGPADFEAHRPMVCFVDTCIWLRSDVFDFRPLLFGDGVFARQCARLASERASKDPAQGGKKASAGPIKDGAYTNLLTGPTRWCDFAQYLRDAPGFYDRAEIDFLRRDTAVVIDALVLSFLEKQ